MRNKVLLTQYRVKKRVNLTDRIFIDRLTALFPNDRHVAAAFFLLYQPKGNGSIGQLAAVRIQRAAIGGHFNVLAALQDKCRNIGTGKPRRGGRAAIPSKQNALHRQDQAAQQLSEFGYVSGRLRDNSLVL